MAKLKSIVKVLFSPSSEKSGSANVDIESFDPNGIQMQAVFTSPGEVSASFDSDSFSITVNKKLLAELFKTVDGIDLVLD